MGGVCAEHSSVTYSGAIPMDTDGVKAETARETAGPSFIFGH